VLISVLCFLTDEIEARGMSKKKDTSNASSNDYIQCRRLCATAKSGPADGLSETSRPVFAQNTPSAPQQPTPSGAIQPSTVSSTVNRTGHSSTAAAPSSPSPAIQPQFWEADRPRPRRRHLLLGGGQGVVPTQAHAASSAVREKRDQGTKKD